MKSAVATRNSHQVPTNSLFKELSKKQNRTSKFKINLQEPNFEKDKS